MYRLRTQRRFSDSLSTARLVRPCRERRRSELDTLSSFLETTKSRISVLNLSLSRFGPQALYHLPPPPPPPPQKKKRILKISSNYPPPFQHFLFFDMFRKIRPIMKIHQNNSNFINGEQRVSLKLHHIHLTGGCH